MKPSVTIFIMPVAMNNVAESKKQRPSSIVGSYILAIGLQPHI